MTQAAQLAQYGANNVGLSFKNRIINGDMGIDQRNAGASVTPTGSAYTLDRWQANIDVASKLSFQQSTTVPTGFINSLLITSLSAYSLSSSEQFNIQQRVEGFNVSDLGWGTANASTVTLSFWVRSSLTGTFGGSFRNSAQDRSYPFSYTISAANTWEQKSVTIPGDTTGTWLTNNGAGLIATFSLGAGSTRVSTAGSWQAGDYRGVTGQTNLVATNGATFFLTGVQLEKGTVATSFDYLPYTTELQLCQRYFHRITGGGSDSFAAVGIGLCSSSTVATIYTSLPVAMRTAPSVSYSGSITVDAGPSNVATFASMGTFYGGTTSIWYAVNCTGNSLTVGRAANIYCGNATTNFVSFSAEL